MGIVIAVDTSFLVPLFISEPMSQRADAWLRRQSDPVLLSPLNLLEFENALALRINYGNLNEAEVARARGKLRKIMGLRLFSSAPESLTGVELWREASFLSRQYTRKLKCRSLDVLQVAFASVAGCEILASFDEGQRELAKELGLNLNPA